jgi:hypothetical protein
MITIKNINIKNDSCFICLYNDGNIHDFPCKNCKLKIHLKCLYDYLNQFENSNICCVCKNKIIFNKKIILLYIKIFLINKIKSCLLFLLSILIISVIGYCYFKILDLTINYLNIVI